MIQQLDLDGRNGDNLPSPTVNGDSIVFRDNDVTNHHDDLLRARKRRLRSGAWHGDRAQPHPQLRSAARDEPPSWDLRGGLRRSAHHRQLDLRQRGPGRELFPDAQGTYVARNVIDGNGQGVIFSRESANNVVENNVIPNPALRFTTSRTGS